MNEMLKIAVGERWQGQAPPPDHAIIGLMPDAGLVMIINYPELKESELEIFGSDFRYYIIDAHPAILWLLDFPQPFGEVLAPFSVKGYPALAEEYLAALANMLHMILLDGPIVAANRLVGLEANALGSFHDCIRRQLASDSSEGNLHAVANEFLSRNKFSDIKKIVRGFDFRGQR